MRKLPLHPFLFAVFPILSMWEANLDYIFGALVIRSLVMSLATASVLLALARLATRGWLKAGLVVSVVILMIFSYGHLYTFLSEIRLANAVVRHRYLLPIILVACGMVITALWKKAEWVSPLTLVFNVAGVVLVVLPSLSVAMYQIRSSTARSDPAATEIGGATHEQSNAPDIYYIILDGYGRQDVLHELYGYDNSSFIEGLRDRGFYVADDSNTNYMQTLLSMASSLNMDYLDTAISQNDQRLSVPMLKGLIANSRLPDFLETHGYQTVAFESSFGDLSWADVVLTPTEDREGYSRTVMGLNEFEGLLLGSTVGRVWLDALKGKVDEILLLEEPYLRHRERVLYALTELDSVARLPGRKFVLVHVVAPHPPFVFDDQGAMVFHTEPYTMGDGDDFKAGSEEYVARYTEQARYISELGLGAIDDILENSSEPPVVVVQGDHGPGAYLTWGSVDESDVRERMGILNAYFFHDGDYSMLYPGISPVNSFRVILDRHFGTSLGTLPDDHFFSSGFDYSMDSSWTVDLVNVDELLDTP